MMLPAAIQVCPVELPGRGRRLNEAALTDVHELAEALLQALPLQVSPWPTLSRCMLCTHCGKN